MCSIKCQSRIYILKSLLPELRPGCREQEPGSAWCRMQRAAWLPLLSPHGPPSLSGSPPSGIELEYVFVSGLSSSQGGAYARGTALRGGCDAELVVFLNCFRSYGDQKTGHTETLGTMRALLESWGRHPGGGLTFQFSEPKVSGVVQFRLTSADQENWMDVSLVPAFDVLGEGSLA